MDISTPKKDTRATIKVCLQERCCQKGSQNVFTALKQGFASEEALVMESPRCLSQCENGPNIAVNDNIVVGVKPISVVETVRAELKNPSCKADGIGSRSIDDLDDVLDDLFTIDKSDKK
jgi:NADH:ubiquinone oxidoreductase subunit E